MSSAAERLRRELEEWFLGKGIERILGRKFAISPCPFSDEEIELAEKANELILCLPRGMNRNQLGEIFGLKSWAIEQNGIKDNVEEEDLWFIVPGTAEMPHLGKSVVELQEMFAKEELEGLSLEMYLVFAARMKDRGQVPDLKKSSWLLRTSFDLYERPLILSMGFFSENRVVADTRIPEDKIFNLGARYARVARSGFVEAAKVKDFPEGAMKAIRVAGRRLLVAKVSGKVYAIENKCNHEGRSLAEGTLQNYTVTCPTHGATFDVRTGEMLELPVGEPEFSGFQGKPINVFSVKITDGKVWIKV